jgi:membrane associated rhomboid family serine protease
VDCVKEGGQTVRQPRAVFGGRAVSGAAVTYTLVALNVAFYLVEWVYPKIVDYLALIGSANDPTVHQVIGVAQGQEYRLLTSAFLHEQGFGGFGPLHLIFNMWALILVGPALERLLGRVRFLALYILSALGGSVLFYLLAPVNELGLGASGAIFGLFGAWFVMSRRLRLDTRGIVVLIAINLALSFFFHTIIAWQDHIGGLLAGALLTAAYAYAPRKNRVAIQVGATVVVVVLIVVAILIRNAELTRGGV